MIKYDVKFRYDFVFIMLTYVSTCFIYMLLFYFNAVVFTNANSLNDVNFSKCIKEFEFINDSPTNHRWQIKPQFEQITLKTDKSNCCNIENLYA